MNAFTFCVTLVKIIIVITNKSFAIWFVPPAASLDNLANTRVVVTYTNMEPKEILALIWLHICIFLVEIFVKSFYHATVYQIDKIRFFNVSHIECLSIELRNNYLEILQQLNQMLLFWLNFLLKEQPNNFIYHLNCFVDGTLLEMLIRR